MELLENQPEQQRVAISIRKFGRGTKVSRAMKVVRDINAATSLKLRSGNSPQEFLSSNLVPPKVAKFAKALNRIVCKFCGARAGQPCKTSTGKLAKKSHAERGK